MAKQKKRGKQKTRKSKADKNVLNSYMPGEHFGLDFFHFWNGDTYVGNYKATVNKELTREGNGKYFTDDGNSYSGIWINDKLSNATRIFFKDGTSYTGHLLNEQFNGQSVYNIPGIGTFSCDFVQGKPLGVVLFDDIDNNKWQGNADRSGIVIRPKNHFFYSEKVAKENIESGEHQDILIVDNTESAKEIEEKKLTDYDNAHQFKATNNM